ncbi:MAG: FG-GAP-like repeat-containing protein [Chloroflexota bacterium]|nr:FG-GAP-like repeat-containing protein [Chloroflexota bacterium]
MTNTVWLNDGAGNFSPHPTTPGFESNNSYATALGDLDGDGDLDAIVANGSVSDTVWLNDGAGNLMPHSNISDPAQNYSEDITLGDLDGDGDMDVIVTTWSYLPQMIWLNDGAGNLTTYGGLDSGYARGVALGDLDGDGDLDAVLAKDDAQAETVWLNDGRAHFSPHPTTPDFGAGESRDVTLGDLDGDGDLDAVVANNNSQPNTVWLNDGAGNLTAHPDSPDFGGGYSQDVSLGDLDGDGDLDAVVSDGSNLDTTVWLNGAQEYGIYLPLVMRDS